MFTFEYRPNPVEVSTGRDRNSYYRGAGDHQCDHPAGASEQEQGLQEQRAPLVQERPEPQALAQEPEPPELIR